MAMKYKYFVCDGGPHLVIPSAIEFDWTGMGQHSDPTDLNTDYQRACQIDSSVGLLSVDSQFALVLGRNPRMTAFVQTTEPKSIKLFVVERLSGSAADSLIDEAVEASKCSKGSDTGLLWALKDKGLTLMFAGDRASNPVYGKLHIDALPGKYRILQSRHSGPHGDLWLFELTE